MNEQLTLGGSKIIYSIGTGMIIYGGILLTVHTVENLYHSVMRFRTLSYWNKIFLALLFSYGGYTMKYASGVINAHIGKGAFE
jgi:hypothetical protein